MSGIEVASLLWSLPGLVIPVTMAVFSCVGDETQLMRSTSDEATMNIRPRQRTPTRRRPGRQTSRSHGLDIGALSLEEEEEHIDEEEEQRQGAATDVRANSRTNIPSATRNNVVAALIAPRTTSIEVTHLSF